MCIVFVAVETHPRYKFVILSNRDESFGRPTLNSDFWTPSTLSTTKSEEITLDYDDTTHDATQSTDKSVDKGERPQILGGS